MTFFFFFSRHGRKIVVYQHDLRKVAVIVQEGDKNLGLWVTKSAVELEHLGLARGGDHEAGIEDTGVG